MTPRFPVTAVHQIELTSRCNLRCRYCVHPHMPRVKQDMPMDIYERALYWARFFVERGTQKELNLCGIGESTLLPDLVERVRMAREAVGGACDIVFATNGLEMTYALAEQLVPYRPRIAVSLHRPEKAQEAVEALKKHGLLLGVSCDPALASVDWAGQVKWLVTAAASECPWVKGGWIFVMSDGRISSCCFDGSGQGQFSDIMSFDPVRDRTRPYDLCKGCHQELNIPGWNQKQGQPIRLHAAGTAAASSSPQPHVPAGVET